jgi:hypothetical protein
MGSDPRLHNESLFVATGIIESKLESSEVVRELLRERERQSQDIGNTTEYNRVREWELSQLSGGHSHGKLVVDKVLDVSLWRPSVWLDYIVTLRLL